MKHDQSIYCYPGSGVLINKPGLLKQQELTNFESTVTTLRGAELVYKPLPGSFDLKHLKDIHRYLFKDVYPFAGKVRTENIAKDTFSFARSEFIDEAAKDLFRSLKNEKQLNGLQLHEFSERAAHYMAEINVLHPFREGNGRSQREFIRCLAQSNGYELDWSRENKDKLLQASIRSVMDPSMLKDSLEKCILNKTPDLEMIKTYKTQTQELER